MKSIPVALVGCGGMGLRHVHGLKELEDSGLQIFRLVALCDLHLDRAEHLASVADGLRLGRPGVYRDCEQMFEKEPQIEAVDVASDPVSHHAIACLAFEAGKHVMVEKPLGVTVRACRRIIDSSLRYKRKLAVAENYRRDPVNRLAKALLERGVLGEPFMALQTSILGGNRIANGVSWKHMKCDGGFPVEMGVHYADILMYLLGEIDEVYSYTAILETTRYRLKHLSPFYKHRATSEPEVINPTSEDAVFGSFRFSNGALGQWSLSVAGHGGSHWDRRIFGSEGSLEIPPDRSGGPISVKLDTGDALSGEGVVELAPDYEVDEITRRLFGPRCVQYDMPFAAADRKLLAIEFYDFAEAIFKDREPEVGGPEGLKATAVAYAFCESAQLGRPVYVQEVERGEIDSYQMEIDESLGLRSGVGAGIAGSDGRIQKR